MTYHRPQITNCKLKIKSSSIWAIDHLVIGTGYAGDDRDEGNDDGDADAFVCTFTWHLENFENFCSLYQSLFPSLFVL